MVLVKDWMGWKRKEMREGMAAGGGALGLLLVQVQGVGLSKAEDGDRECALTGARD